MERYLVVGRGLVGSIFSEASQFDLVSHEEWYNRNLDNYGGMVCAAAISSETACQKARMEDVLKANVQLPMQMLRVAKSNNISFVVFSTSGVYRSAGFRREEDDISPNNRYAGSKVFMEYALQNEAYPKLFIFRIPFVVLFSTRPNDFGSKVANWQKCEDVTGSIVYRADLLNAVLRALQSEAPGGIYNIASGAVHFPSFLEDRFGWRGDIVPANSLGKTPNSRLDVSKAKNAKLLLP